MEQVIYPKVYYRGVATLERLMQLLCNIDDMNVFFEQSNQTVRVAGESSIDKDSFILKIIIWRI